MRQLFVVLLSISFLCGCIHAQQTTSDPNMQYKNPDLPIERRIEDLLDKMTLEEKVRMLGGDPNTHFDTLPNHRLGIPMFSMGDGPHGLRWPQPTTCFPTSVAMAATWDEDLVRKVGEALGREWRAKNRNVLLGPCINLQRNPFGGRNFESFSEDPFLTGMLAVQYVKGVQSQNVVAVPKHYAANNQEWNRKQIDVIVGERALREIYLLPFEMCIKQGGAWSIMGSYNKINGEFGCQNTYLLTDVLKKEWGFQGFVVSDWVAVHDTVASALGGLDLEMPYSNFFGKPLLEAVQQGKVSEKVIDDKVSRILRVMFAADMFENADTVDMSAVENAEHVSLALDVARNGIVLLKNNGLLPLKRSGKVRKIAVLGPNAKREVLGGWGSSMVSSGNVVTPFEGILKSAGQNMQVTFAKGSDVQLKGGDFQAIPSWCFRPTGGEMGKYGLKAEYWPNGVFDGEPQFTRIEAPIDFDWGMTNLTPTMKSDNFSARWTGKLVAPKSGEYVLATTTYGGCRLYLEGEMLIDNWKQHGTTTHKATVQLEAGKGYDFKFEYLCNWGGSMATVHWMPPNWDYLENAKRTAAEADVAVVVCGLDDRFEGEGHDRESLELVGMQDELIDAVSSVNKNTIIVIICGTQIEMPWLDQVAAVMHAWYPGLEGGHAIGDVLFGDFNPCGKLPFAFVHKWEDHSAHGFYPGEPNRVELAEGIYVGYRRYDTNDVDLMFPFGHGLSYTKYEYSDPNICAKDGENELRATVTVKNTGSMRGAEVVQLYVKDVQASVDRPKHELKGFKKLWLQPGESKTAVFTLDKRSFSYYDTKKKKWVAEPGVFEIEFGANSRDIRAKVEYELK